MYYTELLENAEARPSSRGATFMVSGCSFLLTYESHVVGVIHQRAARVGQLNINFWIRLNLLSRAVLEPYLLYKP